MIGLVCLVGAAHRHTHPQRCQPIRCLFVTHKWGDAAPGTGESIVIPHLIDTCQEWGQAEIRTLWTDEIFHAGQAIREPLLQAVADFRPDIAVFTPIPHPELTAQNVSPGLMRECGCQILTVFFDLAQVAACALCEPYAAASDLSVNVDGSPRAIGRRYLPLWPARTVRPPRPKTIDICFVGARRAYPDRMAALDAIGAAGLAVTVLGGRDEQPCSFTEYMATLDRSRIALNFSRTRAGEHQIKARVFEALSAHCCLVEDRNPVTARYLRDGRDYLAWHELDDLVALLKRLLAHPSEAATSRRGETRPFAKHTAPAASGSASRQRCAMRGRRHPVSPSCCAI